MSRVTGVADFKDFVETTDAEYLKKLTFYIGYYNYLMDIPLDTSKFTTEKDWAPFFGYTIKSRSLYKNLGTGHVVLNDRDYLSEQEDLLMNPKALSKIQKYRETYAGMLRVLGYTDEEAKDIARYHYEMEDKPGG